VRRLLLTIAAAAAVCVPAPSANAKGPDSAVVIGPGTIALVEPFAGKVEQALARLAPGEFPRKPFALVYVVRRYLPGEPARWFPGPGVLCDARARCAEAPELRGWFGSGRLTGLFRGEPLHIVSLMREGGRPLPRNGTLAHAIELAFGQASSSTRTAAPQECIALRARWAGSHSSRRPTSFCVGMNGGVYANGRLYPLFSRVAERLIH
jgi:hypothetical protein